MRGADYGGINPPGGQEVYFRAEKSGATWQSGCHSGQGIGIRIADRDNIYILLQQPVPVQFADCTTADNGNPGSFNSPLRGARSNFLR
ncbi:MAG: hypothetical protein OHK0029_10510 [Armatimonadaceae bacterium]